MSSRRRDHGELEGLEEVVSFVERLRQPRVSTADVDMLRSVVLVLRGARLEPERLARRRYLLGAVTAIHRRLREGEDDALAELRKVVRTAATFDLEEELDVELDASDLKFIRSRWSLDAMTGAKRIAAYLDLLLDGMKRSEARKKTSARAAQMRESTAERPDIGNLTFEELQKLAAKKLRRRKTAPKKKSGLALFGGR